MPRPEPLSPQPCVAEALAAARHHAARPVPAAERSRPSPPMAVPTAMPPRNRITAATTAPVMTAQRCAGTRAAAAAPAERPRRPRSRPAASTAVGSGAAAPSRRLLLGRVGAVLAAPRPPAAPGDAPAVGLLRRGAGVLVGRVGHHAPLCQVPGAAPRSSRLHPLAARRQPAGVLRTTLPRRVAPRLRCDYRSVTPVRARLRTCSPRSIRASHPSPTVVVAARSGPRPTRTTSPRRKERR